MAAENSGHRLQKGFWPCGWRSAVAYLGFGSEFELQMSERWV